jgi:hypothetical protein
MAGVEAPVPVLAGAVAGEAAGAGELVGAAAWRGPPMNGRAASQPAISVMVTIELTAAVKRVLVECCIGCLSLPCLEPVQVQRTRLWWFATTKEACTAAENVVKVTTRRTAGSLTRRPGDRYNM